MDVTDHGGAVAITIASLADLPVARAAAARAVREHARANLLRDTPDGRECVATVLPNLVARTPFDCRRHESAAAAVDEALGAVRRQMERPA